MDSTHFHLATPDDVSDIIELVESAYRGDRSRRGWTTEADLLLGQRTDAEEIEGHIASSTAWLLLLREGARLVGSVLIEERPSLAYLGMLAIDPTAQGSGWGRMILDEVERRVLAKNVSVIEMTVIAQRVELIAWYERRGYRTTGEERPFPYGNERFGRPQRDDLYFKVLQKNLRAPGP